MIKLLIFAIFLLAVCGLMWLGHKGILRSRYELEERYLHCRYLAAYLLLLVIFFNRYTFAYVLLAIDKIINWSTLSGFWNTVLPMRRFELVYFTVSLALSNLLLIFLVSILLALVKILFGAKRAFVDVRDMEPLQKLLHLPWVVTAKLYREKEGIFRVTNKGFTMSLWARDMKAAFLVLGAGEILFLLVGIFSSSEFFAEHATKLVQGWYLLPIAGYLLFEQVQFYLESGRDYDAGSFGTEDISEELQGNMKALEHIYCEEFKGTSALIAHYSWEDIRIIRDGLRHNDLNRNQIDECSQPEILYMLNNQLKEAGIIQNTSFQNALIALLNGESINVRDYIQGEFLIYLAVYLNFFVSQEKTFLVLCRNKTRAAMIREQLMSALYQINKIYSIWKVADIDSADGNEEMNILVCSYHDFVNHKLIAKRHDFFRSLSGVVMTDGMEFCAQGNVQKELIFAEFRKIQQKLQYILISETDNASMRTAFEYYTNAEFISYKNDQLRNHTYVMLWEEDCGNKIQRAIGIGRKQAPYLGVSIPLALVGAKYDLPRIRIFASDKMGYYTYQEAMKISYPEILGYLGCNLDLEKMISYNRFPTGDAADLEMLILYDSEYNIYSLLWAWMKYGGKDATMLHVVAPPYMLREYFAANLKSLILRSAEFDALISCRSSLKHTYFQKLLLELSNAGVDEEDLLKKNREYKWNYANVTEILSECLKDVLNSQEFYNIYECFRFEEYCFFDIAEDRYKHRTLIKLTDENIRRRIQGQLAFAKLVTKNDVVEELPVLRGNVCNYYLRGQVVPIHGYMQRIVNVSDGMVFAEQEAAENKKEYFQTGEFVFSNLRKTDECVDLDILDFNLLTADVDRLIYGYWTSTKAVSFQKDGDMKLYDIRDNEDHPIRIQKKNIPILQIRMKRSCFTEGGEKAALLAGFMFQELFKTLFPENHMNLFAAVAYEPGTLYWKNLIEDTHRTSLEEKIHSIIPFVREEPDTANAEYISVYVVEFSSLEMGMITQLYANRKKLFQMTASYLSWYLEAKGSYLNFGGEEPVSCFALEELVSFCQEVLPVYEEYTDEPKNPVPVDEAYVCSFCGKVALFTYRMADDRQMCRSCKQQQIDQKDEIKELYQRTVEFLRKGYHIQLRDNIHIRLRSAEAIAKRCKTSGGGRVLGFYQHRTHELWIESRGPKNAVQDTMIHELTHAWQFDNLNVAALQKRHPEDALKILEGHASYMEVDVMRKLGEEEYADYLERRLMERDDEYGEGFRMLKDYLETREREGSHMTPYKAMQELVDNL